MPTGNDTRMIALREAYRAAAKDDDTEPVEAPVEGEPAAEGEPVPEPIEEPAADPEGETAEQKADRERDEKGRFAAAKVEKEKAAKPDTEPAKGTKAATPKPKPAVASGTPAPKAGAATATSAPALGAATVTKHPGDDLKAPQSWTATAREEWTKVPPVARQEIHRLEGETHKVLNENAQLRTVAREAGQYRQQVEQAVGSFGPVFQAEGLSPMQGLLNLGNTYAMLRGGTREQRAQIVASLLQYSTIDDVNAVVQAQGGGFTPLPQGQAPRPQAQQQPQDLDALLERKLGAMAQQAEASRADQELQTFMAASPEFARDVWQDMQLLLDAAEGAGRKLTYQQAYDRACKMNEDVSAVLARRAEVAAVAVPSSASPAQRARAATATVRSRPTGGVGGPTADTADRRAMLNRAMEKARGQ